MSQSTPPGIERTGDRMDASGAPTDIDQGVAASRIERLHEAAAGLLQPLIAGRGHASLAAELGQAVQQCAVVAHALGLRGPDYLAALLVPFLESPAGRQFIESDRSVFERWTAEMTAFFSGRLEQPEVTGLVAQLDDWLGFAGVPPQFVALIGERLRGDLRQIRDWLRMAEASQESARQALSASVASLGRPQVARVPRPASSGQAPGEMLPARRRRDLPPPPAPPGRSSPDAPMGAAAGAEGLGVPDPGLVPPTARRAEEGPAPMAVLTPRWPLERGQYPWGPPADIALDETAMLAEAARSLGVDLVPVLLESAAADEAGQAPDWDEFLGEYLSRLEHMLNASEYIGAPVLTKLLAGLAVQLQVWRARPGSFGEEGRRLLLLTPDTLADAFASIDPVSIDQLISLLADPGWPFPLEEVDQPGLRVALGVLRVVASRQVQEAPTEIAEDDLSLAIPAEADRTVVSNLLRELPQLSGEFSEAVERLRRGDVAALDQAQRVAHTLKGSANTVGVRGIANLTHRLEDILQLLAREQTLPSEALADQLADAADCVAEMCDAVAGFGPPPVNAEEVLRAAIHTTNALLRADAGGMPLDADHLSRTIDVRAADEGGDPGAAGLTASTAAAQGAEDEDLTAGRTRRVAGRGKAQARDKALPQSRADRRRGLTEEDTDVAGSDAPIPVAAAPAGASEGAAPSGEEGAAHDEGPMLGEGAALEAEEMLRVPAGVVAHLLDFANEAMIALAQMQERIGRLGETRGSLRAGSERFQDLSMELERLVDVRGLALTGRSREADFDALELDEYNDLHTVSRRFAEAGADHKMVDQQFDQELGLLREQIAQLDRIQTDLREAALRTRMVPIQTMAGRLQRAVRQAARLTGKEVELNLFGAETAVDGHLLQALIDPLMHMLRNAVDHGIESPDERLAHGKDRGGRIDLHIERDGAELLIHCQDDGGGLDLDAIIARARHSGLIEAGAVPSVNEAMRLILLPGFSTRERATQLSGRGIGLDVVRERIRELRGRIDLDSEAGRYTRITLAVPMRLAAVPVLLVRSPHHALAISVRDIEQIVSAAALRVDEEQGARIQVGDVDLRAVSLESLLGLPEQALLGEGVERVALVVRDEAGEPLAVVAPEPGQTRNVILRPLPAALPQVVGIGGVAVLGDGAVAPIIDLHELLTGRGGIVQYAQSLSLPDHSAPVCLVVDDSVSVRRTTSLFLQDLGLQVDSASDGIDAIAAVDKRVPDIVIADLEMPRMNGIELAGALRARPDTADVPLIMITSRYSDKHKQLALSAGVDVFLTKPYTEDELAAHIQQCLARAAGEGASEEAGPGAAG